MKTRTKVATLAALAAVIAPAAWGGVARLHNAPIDEYALKATNPQGVHTNAPNDTVSYSNTTVGGPTWSRALESCASVTGLGPMTYHSQPFYVSAAGPYDLTSVQTGGWDGYLLLYQNAFDPLNPLTNCVTGDDDGVGGIGTSDILGVALTAGTQYFLVTTGFDNTEEGPFTNTLTGPGTITLGALGGTAEVSIVKTAPGGFVAGGDTLFTLAAANGGPDPGTSVVVSDTLPGSLTYVSNDCGASVAGNVLTWTIGTMASGASATCNVTANLSSTAGCPAMTNTASISAAALDPTPANNTSSVSNATEAVADGSFEDGTPNGFWTEASTNFGTPLCDVPTCGTGTGTGPHTGDWWAWFGGIAAPETGSVTQTVTIPTGATSMTFWVEAAVCANTTDFVELRVDGNVVWSFTGANALCNTVGYTQQTVNIAAYADGAAHTVAFQSTISGSPSGSNFFIDDVSLAVTTCAAPALPSVLEIPTLNPLGLAALALGLAGLGLALLRRRTA